MDTNDKAQYNYLLSIVDPTARFGPEEEALLTVFFIFILSGLLAYNGLYSQYWSIYYLCMLTDLNAIDA